MLCIALSIKLITDQYISENRTKYIIKYELRNIFLFQPHSQEILITVFYVYMGLKKNKTHIKTVYILFIMYGQTSFFLSKV